MVQVFEIMGHIFDLKPEKKGVYPNYEYNYFGVVGRNMKKGGFLDEMIHYDFENIKNSKAITQVLKIVESAFPNQR